MTPAFHCLLLILHRGGGELGRQWYLQSVGNKKYTSFQVNKYFIAIEKERDGEIERKR